MKIPIDKISFVFLFLLFVSACSKNSEINAQYAEVLNVSVSGNPPDYSFSVTIKSPDTGCEQFADWWEVITADGDLIYRRILLHSHVDEQPFTRSGGPVKVNDVQEVIIRAHMNHNGYGEIVIRGTVAHGFKQVILPSDFASSLEKEEPLPDGCDF